MIVNVFLLGRPGSGKSIVARLIEMFAKEKCWSVEYINDYQLLQTMFLQEKEENIAQKKRKFSPSGPEGYNGFDVIDFSVLDTVLFKMAEEVTGREKKCPEEDKLLFLIEFARNNYRDALLPFGHDILHDAQLIYLDVEVNTCVERIHQRVAHSVTSDDLFVSDEIMSSYYRNDDWSRVGYDLQLGYDKRVIKNTGSFEELKQKVDDWVKSHIEGDV